MAALRQIIPPAWQGDSSVASCRDANGPAEVMMRTSVLISVALLASSARSQSADYTGPKEKLHIYLLVGQSNMSGRAKVEDEDRRIPDNLFLLDGKGKWVQATH